MAEDGAQDRHSLRAAALTRHRTDFPCPFALIDQIGRDRCAKLDFARLLLEAAKALKAESQGPKVRLMMCVDHVRLEPMCQRQLIGACILMLAGAFRRLDVSAHPELLVIVKQSTGELHVSTIENSGLALAGYEQARIRELIMPLGGVHDCELKAALTESTFSFLIRGDQRLTVSL